MRMEYKAAYNEHPMMMLAVSAIVFYKYSRQLQSY
jgi:hypothetical protein